MLCACAREISKPLSRTRWTHCPVDMVYSPLWGADVFATHPSGNTEGVVGRADMPTRAEPRDGMPHDRATACHTIACRENETVSMYLPKPAAAAAAPSGDEKGPRK